jgi:hypothetical protein
MVHPHARCLTLAGSIGRELENGAYSSYPRPSSSARRIPETNEFSALTEISFPTATPKRGYTRGTIRTGRGQVLVID